MSITKSYMFHSVPYEITCALKNWYHDIFPVEMNTMSDSSSCVHFCGDDNDYIKWSQKVLVSWNNKVENKYIFSLGGNASNFYFPKIFFTNFLNFSPISFASLQKSKLCYLSKNNANLYKNKNVLSEISLEADDSESQNFYKFTLCFSVDDVWTAIQVYSIPILFVDMHEKDQKIFNKSRYLLYTNDITSLLSLYDNNDCLYKFLYEQPIFNPDMSYFFENQKNELRSHLLPLMLKNGYFPLSNMQVPLLQQDLDYKYCSKQNYSMMQYNSFYLNFPYQNVLHQKQINTYDPTTNGRRVLILFAAHINTQTKFEILQNNLAHFRFQCVDIVVGNTAGLQYSSQCKSFCESTSIKYFEIENDEYIDFGKYMYLLGETNYKNYHTVLFTNDSYIIHSPLDYFINSAIKTTASLYAYNDSSENKYHFQSYLFAVKAVSISQFLNLFMDHFEKIKIVIDHHDVIKYYEMNLFSAFDSVDCFLKIAKLQRNLNKNIFFNNDELYKELLVLGLLPFTKLKRYLKETFQSPQSYAQIFPKRQIKYKQSQQFILQTDPFSGKF